MKYEVQPTTKFKKDLKLCKSRGYDIELINQIIKKLANVEKLEDIKLIRLLYTYILTTNLVICDILYILPSFRANRDPYFNK